MSSCIRHLKTLFLPQSKCRLICYLFEFISARFFCLVPLWCDLRKSLLLSCTFTFTIFFLFEVDTIILLPRSKYCYNLFRKSDCHRMASNGKFMIQWSAMYLGIKMLYTKTVNHYRSVYDQLIVNWFWIIEVCSNLLSFSAMFVNGCQNFVETLYESNCNWHTSNILVFTLLCLNVFTKQKSIHVTCLNRFWLLLYFFFFVNMYEWIIMRNFYIYVELI